MRQVIWLVFVCACTNYAGGDKQDPNVEHPGLPTQHDARFEGLWAVSQPYHALYEQTLYWFNADGTLGTSASVPNDCSGHLSAHCVTGSVANCLPAAGQTACTGTISCVFGTSWGSVDASTLVIDTTCSDGVDRLLTLAFNPDSSTNAGFGAHATIVDVDGDANWSHDNWEWAFQKCPDGVEATCPFGSPL